MAQEYDNPAQGDIFAVLAEIREKEALTFRSVKATAMKEAFEAFDVEYPEVAEMLAEATRHYLRETGNRRMGFPMVWELVRYRIETDRRPYRLNNNLRSWFARAVMARYPDLKGVYEVRTSYADEEAA
jgi:hypothetical protein